MVVGILVPLAGFVKARVSKTIVDNTVFRFHYRWTTSFCYLCCALVAASDFIGQPIECENASKAVTTYCWVTSTYTINTTTDDSGMNLYGSHGSKFNGIGRYDEKIHEKTFHAYYQWVPFILFFQGCLFYLPHTLWKTIEGKQLENLLQGLNNFSILDESLEMKKKNIIKYLKNSWGLNKKYCYGYFLCEALNFANVIGQMFMLDSFFGGMFLHNGAKVLLLPTKDDKGRFDPLIETFPRVTKCDFFKYGASGSIQTLDYLCILPQNLLNEKIFLVMWVWFVFLAFVTAVQLVFHILVSRFPAIRLRLLEQRGKVGRSSQLEHLLKFMDLGDFFLLQAIGKNINAFTFSDIIKSLTEEIKYPPSAQKGEIGFSLNHSFISEADGDILDLKYRKKTNHLDDTNV